MTRGRISTALGVLTLALPALVAAQGLGDAATRERAKREAKKAEAKVFTNEDLEQGRPPGALPASGGATDSTPSSSAAPSPQEGQKGEQRAGQLSSEEDERRANEKTYVEGLQAAQSHLGQLEARIRELQAKLNPMSTTFIYGDFNVSGDKAAEEAEVRAELTQSEADLAAARQAVAAATQALQDFKQGRVPAPIPVE